MGSNANRWSPDEDAVITRDDLSLGQMAELVGRTYRAVHHRRVRLKRRGVDVPSPPKYKSNSPRHCEEHAVRANGCPRCLALERIYMRRYRTANAHKVREYQADWARTRPVRVRSGSPSGPSQSDYNRRSLSFAVRAFEPWTERDLEVALDPALTVMQAAATTQRTYNEIQNRRANAKRGRKPRKVA